MLVRKAESADASRLSELYNQLVNNPAVKVEPEQIQALYDDERSDSHIFFEKQGFKGTVKRGFVKYRSAFSSADKNANKYYQQAA